MPRLKAAISPIYSAGVPSSLTPSAHRSPFWWVRWVPLAVGMLLFLDALYVTGRVALIPLLASFALAYILNPLVEQIERSRLSRPLAVAAALLIVVLLITSFCLFVIPDLWNQSMVAGSRIFRNFTPANALHQRQRLQHFSPFLDRLIGLRLQQTLRDPSSLFGGKNDWVAGALTHFFSTAAASLDLVVIPFFVYYILVDFANWREDMEDLVPPRFRSPIRRLLDEVGRILQSYVLGQLLIAMMMGALYAVGFAVLHVPAWAGIATLAGFLNVIPYVGTVSGLLLASGFTYAQTESLWRVGGVVLVFAAVQSIEGYYLTPKVLGERLRLHPMSVFLGLLIGGKLFGLLGILLAVPTLAVSQVAVKLLRELYKASYFYHAGDFRPIDAPSPMMEERLAVAADNVLTEQVEEERGDELLAPKKSTDDIAARQRS